MDKRCTSAVWIKDESIDTEMLQPASEIAVPSYAETRHIIGILTKSSFSGNFGLEWAKLMVDDLPDHLVDLHLSKAITWSLSRCYFLCCVNDFYDWSSELLKLTVKALKLKASGESQPIYIFGPPISTVQQSQGRDTGLGTRDRDDGMSETKNKNEKLEEGEQTIQMFRSTQLWEWSI